MGAAPRWPAPHKRIIERFLSRLDMDTLFLRDVKFDVVIGLYEWERVSAQTILLDIDIRLPTRCACTTDNVADTIDYGQLVKRLEEALAETRFTLVEALAQFTADIILNEFGAPWTRVSVTKLGLLANVRRLGVTIERTRLG